MGDSAVRLTADTQRKQDHSQTTEDTSTPGSLPRMDDSDSQSFYTEHHATGRAGSTGSLDCIEEDFNRSDASRTTGFMGKNSEVSWLGKLRGDTDSGPEDEDQDNSSIGFGSGLDESRDQPAKEPKKYLPLAESNYHCDDLPLPIDDSLQPYQLPASATADLLLACYLESVHPAFPILGKTTFVKQYKAFYANPNLKTGPRWLAVLNLVFAIGARYGHLIRAEWRELAEDHEVYFARARLLGLDAGGIWLPAELQRIQVHALASFYLVATHQINRSAGPVPAVARD
ncbi:MAG: hypothetical protein LQ346_005548 [Caloplaca aetnensis]|nr:MAG: hypothetical protein LQ346_005548 [Caloplaca aetnensis]